MNTFKLAETLYPNKIWQSHHLGTIDDQLTFRATKNGHCYFNMRSNEVFGLMVEHGDLSIKGCRYDGYTVTCTESEDFEVKCIAQELCFALALTVLEVLDDSARLGL